MSRIYVITDKDSGLIARYIRAHTLNGALRAAANEVFGAKAASTEEVFQAMKGGADVLDAIEAEVEDGGADDPGPVPARAA